MGGVGFGGRQVDAPEIASGCQGSNNAHKADLTTPHHHLHQPDRSVLLNQSVSRPRKNDSRICKYQWQLLLTLQRLEWLLAQRRSNLGPPLGASTSRLHT